LQWSPMDQMNTKHSRLSHGHVRSRTTAESDRLRPTASRRQGNGGWPPILQETRMHLAGMGRVFRERHSSGRTGGQVEKQGREARSTSQDDRQDDRQKS
jgi:hypothetical protein